MKIVGSYLRAVFSGATIAPIDEPMRDAIDRLNDVTDRIVRDNTRARLSDTLDRIAEDRR